MVKRLPAPADDPRGWVTPEPLNVAPALIGQALATPKSRALAMAVDLALVALLSGASGLWLVGGLLLVALQLRGRRDATAGRRLIVGWVAAALALLLAAQEANQLWQAQRHPRTAAQTQAAARDDADDDESADAAAAALQAALTAKTVVSASNQASNPASTVASTAASNAAASVAARDAARIAQLEAQLAEARKPPTLRRQLQRLADGLGAKFGWGIVYFSLLPAWWGGQTVGKKLFHLRVVDLTGKPMTVMRCLKRYGGYAAGMATGGLGFLQVFWDPNRQAIQDKTAHTVVIDLRAPPLVPPAAPHDAATAAADV
ncbi:MAG: RDD family protein [Burkholderiales bacterium]|nr:RDD family protein [Burkholderiales bacterium]